MSVVIWGRVSPQCICFLFQLFVFLKLFVQLIPALTIIWNYLTISLSSWLETGFGVWLNVVCLWWHIFKIQVSHSILLLLLQCDLCMWLHTCMAEIGWNQIVVNGSYSLRQIRLKRSYFLGEKKFFLYQILVFCSGFILSTPNRFYSRHLCWAQDLLNTICILSAHVLLISKL